jgi:hypothetical protein
MVSRHYHLLLDKQGHVWHAKIIFVQCILTYFTRDKVKEVVVIEEIALKKGDYSVILHIALMVRRLK